MCDAVAVMPVTVTLAFTERSSPTVTVPVPAAVPATGGTSLLPDSVTCSANDIEAQPANSPMAAASMSPARRG